MHRVFGGFSLHAQIASHRRIEPARPVRKRSGAVRLAQCRPIQTACGGEGAGRRRCQPLRPGYRVRAITASIVLLLLSGYAAAAPDPRLGLTQAETAWLEQHPELVLAPAVDFAPYEFFDDKGSYRGVAADYIALLEKRLGVHFRAARLTNEAARLQAMAAGRIDIVTAVTTDSPLADEAQLARPHITMPGVIVAKSEYRNLHSLQGRRVALVSDAHLSIDTDAVPGDVELVPVQDVTTALELISEGRIDALVTDMATASYYIHREGMTDIRIVGKTGTNLSLAVAVRRDWPQLLTIMEKALDSITRDERQRIARQWIHLKESSLLYSRNFWIAMLAVALVILLVLVSILVWNRTLKQQVAQHTQSLNLELRRRHEAEQELQEAHADLISSHRELKQTQLQLIHAAKMESVGRLAAGVAHEVKNPLAVIRLGMDYIAGEMRSDPVLGDVLADMETAVRRADRVTNGLLDFSREGELSCREVRINDIIENSLHLVRHELVQHNIDVVKSLDSELPMINCDANRMQQVFVNLLMNAIQAMKKDGTITVSTYQTVMREQRDTQAVSGIRFKVGQSVIAAEVCDTGPGVAEHALEKMFDPFYTTKPVGKGTGLGLSVIRNIVDLHRGAIEVKNLLPRGLSVNILLKEY
ncbi:MAG: transporter substrate-binding domain-containing protein [Gammaproteobacteria bacterium]|nr:MAG: transporter substrate-binding domain-containing protein [Gammaproteobacteria bacterium]